MHFLLVTNKYTFTKKNFMNLVYILENNFILGSKIFLHYPIYFGTRT